MGSSINHSLGSNASPNFDYWQKIAVLKASELAALMQGFDPRAMGDVVVCDPLDPSNPYGVSPDLISDIRMINSAASGGLIRSSDASIEDLDSADTKIVTDSLGDWLAEVGHANLACALGLNYTTINPAPYPPIKISALATSAELIGAFGAFTGMSSNWFKNVKDKPSLKRARKVVGRGQRGLTIEPLFCPYEVMLWLIATSRRVGTPLRNEKGWELLEKYFPSAYAAHSIGDPRIPAD